MACDWSDWCGSFFFFPFLLFGWRLTLWCLCWLSQACGLLESWFFMCWAVALLLSSFFTISLIMAVLQLLVASDKHLARNSWSHKPKRKISLEKIYVVLRDIDIGLTVFVLYCATHLHLNQLGWMTWRSYLAISTLACGFQNFPSWPQCFCWDFTQF